MANNFAIIGVASFVAPRHLEAIKASGQNLIAAFDVNDSVGIIDRFFPDCQFFTKLEQFEAFLEHSRREGKPVDYVSICTPNYLHTAHIQSVLRLGANAVCEKPLVLTIAELDEIKRAETQSGRRVYTVLQLRVHDAIIALKKKIESEQRSDYVIDLNYLTSRGQWYHESWKGDVAKSGGLSTNIGIHFFDMLTWIFGPMKDVQLLEKTPSLERGTLQLEKARVNWLLSIERSRLPESALKAGQASFRSIRIDGQEFEFSEGFGDLHTKVYKDILAGRGYGLEDARTAIAITERLRKF